MALSAAALSVGDVREVVVVDNLTRTQLVQYAGASGDFNPLHHDEIYATQVAKYPSVFGHGMLTMAMAGRMLTDWVGDGRLRRFGVRFAGQVWPGDTLTARATVEEIRREGDEIYAELAVTTVNQDGTTVISGYATARIDP
jgi:acyl dehydratase